jgi:hypothetical protein
MLAGDWTMPASPAAARSKLACGLAMNEYPTVSCGGRVDHLCAPVSREQTLYPLQHLARVHPALQPVDVREPCEQPGPAARAGPGGAAAGRAAVAQDRYLGAIVGAARRPFGVVLLRRRQPERPVGTFAPAPGARGMRKPGAWVAVGRCGLRRTRPWMQPSRSESSEQPGDPLGQRHRGCQPG